MMDDDTLLRRGAADLADDLSRRPAGGAVGSAKRIFQIYSGGAMGSGAPMFYLGHPVKVAGDEVEGAAATLAVGAASVPILFVRGAPAVGDYVVAKRAGGRWVAEQYASTGFCPGCATKPDTINMTFPWLLNAMTGTAITGTGRCGGSLDQPFNVYSAALSYGGFGSPPSSGLPAIYHWWQSPYQSTLGWGGGPGTISVVLYGRCQAVSGCPTQMVAYILATCIGSLVRYDTVSGFGIPPTVNITLTSWSPLVGQSPLYQGAGSRFIVSD